jgi:hypothetical protein
VVEVHVAVEVLVSTVAVSLGGVASHEGGVGIKVYGRAGHI